VICNDFKELAALLAVVCPSRPWFLFLPDSSIKSEPREAHPPSAMMPLNGVSRAAGRGPRQAS
jgi:hypothetical protein